MGTLASNNNINSLPQAPRKGTEAVEHGSYLDFDNVSGTIFKLRPNICKKNEWVDVKRRPESSGLGLVVVLCWAATRPESHGSHEF